MSLPIEVYTCIKVPPVIANYTFDVTYYVKLRKIQRTGFVNVWREQVGRNCLNELWREKYDKDYDKMCIVYKEEIKYLFDDYCCNYNDSLAKFGIWCILRPNTDFDFLYIEG